MLAVKKCTLREQLLFPFFIFVMNKLQEQEEVLYERKRY